ncbi:hypothetical protein AZ09_00730 [Acetobacter aceti 1023]|nr:hypothetical protein AZ09_00730 [Acetobacter aceti 1023]
MVRIGTVYNLRRWVPLDVRQIIGKNELWHSLETSDKELAKNRACVIFSLTSDFFASVKIVKSYLYEPATELVDSLDIRDDLVKNAISKIIESYELQIKEMRTQFKLQQAEHYMERMEDYQRLKNLTEIVEKSKPKLNAIVSYMKDSKDFDAYTSIKTIQQQFEQVQTWVKPPEKRKSPTLSKALEAYLNGHESKLTDSDRRGIINTVKRFIEVCEDKEIRDYTGEDAGKFREIMEKMPENYGKSRNDTRTVFELVEHAKKNNLGKISEKTIKNHFARLSSIWNYYLLRDLTDRNIFIGWRFDGKVKIKRIRWNDEQLQTLMSSSWNSPTISKKTFGYIVGLGSYSGMRLEEICRIRIQDIIEIRGIPCIFIRDHEARKNRPWEKWSPKTEAGERVVPIGEALINSGFLRFIEQQKNKKQYYLFSELKFSGKDKKRSDGFQQSFSRFKLRRKIPKGVDFHSFRHNVSTKLRNLPDGMNGLRESWIDDFLGHEGQNKSVGNVVYLDIIDVENLKKVADSVLYPDFWNIKNLIGKNNV